MNNFVAVVFIFALCFAVARGSSALIPTSTYRPCVEMMYLASGEVDVEAMLYNCTANIPGSLTIPSYYKNNGVYAPLNVGMQLVVNNLMSIEDVNSEVTLDFWFRNAWVDPRLIFPDEFWGNLNPVAKLEGLDITQYVVSSNQLMIWLPDIIFFEGIEIENLVQGIKIFPNGSMFWSRHILTTLSEGQMNLHSYPLDTQNISLTFQSYAYASKLLNLVFIPGKAVVINTNDQLNNVAYVNLNNLWHYHSFSAYTQLIPTPVVFDPTRSFDTAYVNLCFTRQSFGITYRLGLPVTICMIIVGFSFWSGLETRVDVTLQMVLVLAALYLIVGQIIPFVGYFTIIDNFITTAFLMLSCMSGIHFWCIVLDRKLEKYPLNRCIGDTVTFVAQAVWIPLSMLIFSSFFNAYSNVLIGVIALSTLICFSHAYSRRSYLWRSIRVSIMLLRIKAGSAASKASYKRGSAVSGELGKVVKLTALEEFALRCFEGKVLSNSGEDIPGLTSEGTTSNDTANPINISQCLGDGLEMTIQNTNPMNVNSTILSHNNNSNSNSNSNNTSIESGSVGNVVSVSAATNRMKRVSLLPRTIRPIHEMDSDDDF